MECISIILPTYNRAHLIKKSIDSVLNQTYKFFELIIVDDGSNDNTGKIIKRIKDKRILYYKLDKNCGQSYARNFGIKKAKYNFIAFQDSDDEWASNKLEKQINYIYKNPDFDSVYSYFIRMRSKNNLIFPRNYITHKEGMIYDDLLNHSLIGSSTFLVKKDILIKIGLFDEKLRAFEDHDLFLRIAKFHEIGFLGEILVTAYGNDHISDSPKLLINSILRLIKKHKYGYATTKDGLCRQYLKLMDAYIRIKDKDNSYKYFKKIISDNPFNLKAYLLVFCSCFGVNFYQFIRNFYFNYILKG